MMSTSQFAQHAFETYHPAPSPAPKADGHFTAERMLDLDRSAVSAKEPAHAGTLRCAPDDDQQVHMFHWLVFAAAPSEGNDGSSAGCDLWRWHRGEWRSVFVAGATFTPEEMHAQGWRYCAPSVQLFVRIGAKATESHGAAGRAEPRPNHPVGVATAPMPPKRNRTLALAVPAHQPAWPRPASPMRRGRLGSV